MRAAFRQLVNDSGYFEDHGYVHTIFFFTTRPLAERYDAQSAVAIGLNR